MDTAKLNDVIQAAGKVQYAAGELINDSESEAKATALAEALDEAAAIYDEVAEALVAPVAEEAVEEETPEEPAPEEVVEKLEDATATLREWAGLPPVVLMETGEETPPA